MVSGAELDIPDGSTIIISSVTASFGRLQACKTFQLTLGSNVSLIQKAIEVKSPNWRRVL